MLPHLLLNIEQFKYNFMQFCGTLLKTFIRLAWMSKNIPTDGQNLFTLQHIFCRVILPYDFLTSNHYSLISAAASISH